MSIFTSPHLSDSARWKNLRVGLLGGSFDPPHEGHVHISLAAMKGLHLDAIWWLVSPQNPIKALKPLPFDQRFKLCQDLVRHPRILISDLERQLGTSITYHTIKKIKARYLQTNFVWISGMDNALNLHRWNYWQELLSEVCMVHLTRNPARSLVTNCPLRMYAKQNHVFMDKGGDLPLRPGTTYWMLQKKMVNISSTQIRQGERENKIIVIPAQAGIQ